MEPGSVEWLKARIVEHEAAREQAIAQANAHAGAKQAYERLLKEMGEPQSTPGEV